LIQIVIADDHPIVLKGLKEILGDEPDMKIVGEGQNGQNLLDLVQKYACDIVIMDITMPGRGGLDVLRELKQAHPRLPVLILSMHSEDQYGVRALKAGAAGYLTKESAPDRLIGAVRKIAAGGKYITPTLAEKLAFDLERGSDRTPHEGLSDREYQVMTLIASGKTVGDIAGELNLSVKTISTYRTRILEKMKMKSNAELTYYAIKNDLVK
jgi:two-component system, NarL family, invasion response regulator UvrY